MRQVDILDDLTIRNAVPGMTREGTQRKSDLIADGNNLFLQVTRGNDGAIYRSWIFRYVLDGRENKMGLGPYPRVKLAEAREEADELYRKIRKGIDPLAEREAEKAKRRTSKAKDITFKDAAKKWYDAHKSEWSSAKYGKEVWQTLDDYAFPIFGKLRVRDIDTGIVLRVLEPIWTTKRETARRIRQKLEQIFDWCKAHGFRDGDNPAAWEGNLKHSLADPKKVNTHDESHHPALPHKLIPEFMTALRAIDSPQARALEFTILTALRAGEGAGAQFSEIADGIYKVPASRMKRKGKPHEVPLSPQAIAIVEARRKVRSGPCVFVSRAGKATGRRSMLQLLDKMNDARETRGLPRWTDPLQANADITVHGFRSTFRDWVADETDIQGEVAEAALHHKKADKVEGSYQRSQLLKKRRALMELWANWCDGIAPAKQEEPTNIVEGDFGRKADKKSRRKSA
jgi:integrase